MIWTAVLIGAVPMAVTVYVAQNLLKNQRPVVYYGGLIGAGLLAWQITEWLDRRYRLSRPDLFASEDDDWSEGDYSMWDYGEPACQICQEHTDEPNTYDKSCEVCDMLLCEWCYNDESHTCLKKKLKSEYSAEYMMGFEITIIEMWHWADVPEDIIKQGKNAIAEYIWTEGELCDGEEWEGMEEDMEDSGDDWTPLLDTLQKV